jgi:hypothetical protein
LFRFAEHLWEREFHIHIYHITYAVLCNCNSDRGYHMGVMLYMLHEQNIIPLNVSVTVYEHQWQNGSSFWTLIYWVCPVKYCLDSVLFCLSCTVFSSSYFFLSVWLYSAVLLLLYSHPFINHLEYHMLVLQVLFLRSICFGKRDLRYAVEEKILFLLYYFECIFVLYI